MTPETFAQIFAGRTDAYGETHHWAKQSVEAIHAAVTFELFEQHLKGERDIGIYPVRPDNSCRWGCIDIDFEDFELAVILGARLDEMGLAGWIEASQSKGYHVWVFAAHWVPAAWMRRTLLIACEASDYEPKEVNPKRETGEVLGNFVRLPLFGGAPHGRRVFLDTDGWEIDRGLLDFEASLASSRQLRYWASKWIPPQKGTMVWGAPSSDVWQILDSNKYIRRIHDEGCFENKDRSSTLAHLAHVCREAGYSPATTLAIVESADRTSIHKFDSRNDGPQRYTELVERAFS